MFLQENKKDDLESCKFNFIIYKCFVKLTTQIIWDDMLSKQREIDVLMIFHKFDSKPIFLTHKFCYEMDEDLTQHFSEAND